MMPALLIVILIVGAFLLLLGGKVARRCGLPEEAGIGMALVLAGISVTLAPSHWRESLVAGGAGEQILTLARDIGLSGLFFLAGARLDLRQAWQARRLSLLVAASGLLFAAVVFALLVTFGGQDRYAVMATAVALSGASLWLPGQLSSRAEGRKQTAIAALAGAAIILTAVLMLVVNLLAAFSEAAGRAHSVTAYSIVTLYELVKVAVVFALAYFFASRFLTHAAGKLSAVRMTSGYLLIAILLFALALKAIGPLGALGWAFIAGALLNRSEIGGRLAKAATPAATALFLSLAFLPMLVQPHGRSLSGGYVLMVVVVALVSKLALAWLAARLGGASSREAMAVATASTVSAEVSVMFLGFAVSRWLIDSPAYYCVLLFALASLVVGPLIWHLTGKEQSKAEAGTTDTDNKSANLKNKTSKRSPGKKVSFALLLIFIILGGIASTARAQSADQAPVDDPVIRAMKAAEASVNDRARSAGVVLAASKYVNESTVARKQGDKPRAEAALKQAAEIARQADDLSRSALIEELARVLAAEQSALNPKMGENTTPFPTDRAMVSILPRSVTARLGQYRDSFTQILQEENVPVGLLGVALVESKFNPFALSPKGARGIWQFMPATAVRYGLTVQPGNDHRTHPEHSTRAAARYLRYLYEMFGDWKLALASYNWGEGNLQQVIKRTGVRDFNELARRKLLPRETRDYVPAVLAAWARITGPVMVKASAPERQKGQTQ